MSELQPIALGFIICCIPNEVCLQFTQSILTREP